MTAPATNAIGRRQRLELLRAQLDTERQSFVPTWRELAEYITPRRPRFVLSDTNRGDRRSKSIIDLTATFAARSLSSGMVSNVTSPARPWHRLTTGDPDLAESAAVKDWLHIVTERMRTVWLRSNLYNALPNVYSDMGVFGTAAMSVEEDEEDVVRFRVFPIGSYWIANDARGKVRVFMREFRMTVRQLVQQFGAMNKEGKVADWSIFSTSVRSAYEGQRFEETVDVIQVIEPNQRFNPAYALSKYKQFSSCYYERGNQAEGGNERLLLEQGFDEFPILAIRWSVNGEDTYGTDSPGTIALGDIKQLQKGEKLILQAMDKLVNPPLVGSPNLRNAAISSLPGGITFDESEVNRGLRPLYEMRPEIQHLSAKQQEVRHRVQRAFYEDLFLMLAQSDRREITAREIDERHEEKLLALGPVLEQLNQDMLDPLVDRTFAIMLRRGEIPEPPEELHGVKLKVEYISVMAQAQKMVGLASIDRFIGQVGHLAEIAAAGSSVLDKVDLDQVIDEYAESTGVPPRLVVPDDQVAAIRQQRAQASQAAQTAANIKELSAGAKNLATAPTDGKNALTDLMGSM